MGTPLMGPSTPFDLESTGVSVEDDRIVTACVGRLRPAAGPWEVAVKSWLIDPQVDIPEEATAVHGITTEHARANGRPPAEALDLIAAELALAMRAGQPLVGANLAYDNTLLDRELRRHGLPTVEERLDGPIAPVIDVYVLDKALDPYRRGSRKLVDLCQVYDVRIDGAHDSTFDALAAARIAYRMGQRSQWSRERLCEAYAERRHPERIADAFLRLGRMSLGELHDAQVRWRAKQQESLAQYFRRLANESQHEADKAADAGDNEQRVIAELEAEELVAKAEGVCGDWPLIPFAVQAALV